MDLTTLYCDVDDYVNSLKQQGQIANTEGKGARGPCRKMSISEFLTIIIYYHASGFKHFKAYYKYLTRELRAEFPNLLSYSRFSYLKPKYLLLLVAYMETRKGEDTGINFIDSTPLKVCHNARIKQHKVFKGFAERGRSSMGWFFGFKLHLVINHLGEILSVHLTKGNVDDRVPVPEMCQKLQGKLFGDKGYLSKQLTATLMKGGVQLVTGIRKNMKNRLIDLTDKLLLRKRFIIETVNDQLKNISNIEHSRHRSPKNFLVNLVAGLVAYTWQNKKPAIRGIERPQTYTKKIENMIALNM